MRFWVGGYTAEMDGVATGVGMLLAGAADDALAGGPLGFGGDVVATGGSPSWIARHPSLDVLYAALEGDGTVQAFRRTGETSFAKLGPAVDAGDSTCHVAVAPDGRSLVASCWGDGRVVRMTLDAEGRPSAPAAAAAAVDPYGPDAEPAASGGVDLDLAAAARALREAAGEEYAHLVPEPHAPDASTGPEALTDDARRSHAHQAVFLSHGVVATTDMGLDLVRFWRTTDGGLAPLQQMALPHGSGPRHMLAHPSGHLYVVTELTCELFALAPDPATGPGALGTWRVVGGSRLSPATAVDVDFAAEITASRDQTVVYAGVRGSNAIAALRVKGDGGAFEPLALVESGVDWPRHHIVERDTLLVAGQRSDEIASLSIDLRTGVPGRVRHRTPAPSPTFLMKDR
jgi:6-phosphogluconolactonase (cycloisomerase 2 family)